MSKINSSLAELRQQLDSLHTDYTGIAIDLALLSVDIDSDAAQSDALAAAMRAELDRANRLVNRYNTEG